MRPFLALAVAALMAARPAMAQSLSDRIAAVRDGTIGMHFRARPGVCGNEDGGIRWMRGNGNSTDTDNWNWRDGPCVTGPVEVTL
ncbi:MAG: hypothetical protein ACREPM_25025, partial [Gemmatimonadaceae bacterium]